MEEVRFELFNILLENNIKSLKRYLKKSNIPFEKNKTNIVFEASIDEYNTKWDVFYKKNSVLKAFCTCDESIKSSSEFRHYLSKFYIFMYKNPLTNFEYYLDFSQNQWLLQMRQSRIVSLHHQVGKRIFYYPLGFHILIQNNPFSTKELVHKYILLSQ